MEKREVGAGSGLRIGVERKGESKSTLIYGNPLGLELANSDRLALIAAFPLSFSSSLSCSVASTLPFALRSYSRVYFSRSRRMASDEISRLPRGSPLMLTAVLIAETRGNRLPFARKNYLCRRSRHEPKKTTARTNELQL